MKKADKRERKRFKYSSNVIPKKNTVSSATAKYVRISPRKARLVLDLIRGEDINTATRLLSVKQTKAARIVSKVLKDAVANAQQAGAVDLDSLWVTAAFANEGRTLKRIIPRARGRADVIRKRSSHITVVLGED